MKKKLMVIILLLAVGFAFGQVANQLGWRDFRAFTGLIDSTDSAIQDVYNHIVSVQSEKVAIMDDADRLAEIRKIIEIHPDYSVAELQSKFSAFITLKAYLIDNGYIN